MQLRKNPILTKALTSAVMSGLGNVAAQAVVARKGLRDLDLKQVGRFAALGLLLSPISHYKFLWLEGWFRFVRGKKAVYAKLAVDQLVFGPLLNVLFYVLMAVLEGRPSASVSLVKANFWPTTINSWKLWPAANWISFNYVPLELRVLFVNVVAFFWVIILSAIASRK